MKINLQHGLPIVSLTLTHNSQSIILPNVLFDIGCVAAVFDTDGIAQVGIYIAAITPKSSQPEHHLFDLLWISESNFSI